MERKPQFPGLHKLHKMIQYASVRWYKGIYFSNSSPTESETFFSKIPPGFTNFIFHIIFDPYHKLSIL